MAARALLLGVALALASSARAQAPTSLGTVSGVDGQRTFVPVNVGLAPGLDVNAAFAHPVNALSIGVIGSQSEAVHGLGFGGLLQLSRDEVSGAQLAGGAALAGGDFTGWQGAFGFARSRGVFGAQTALGAALSTNGVRGAQAAFGVSTAEGSVRGAQLALGVAGLRGEATGAQLAGVMGIAHGELTGVQAAGAFAVADTRVRGAQLSGFAAAAREIQGVQSAGLVAVARDVRGAQISVINVARRVEGAQVGLINVADEVHGATLGILNIVAHGGTQTLTLAMSDVTPLGLEGRLGSRRVYSVLGLGLRPYDMGELPRATFGMGVRMVDAETFSLQAEAMVVAASTREQFAFEEPPVERLQVLVRYAFDPQVHAFFGPALNGLASREGRRLADLSDAGSLAKPGPGEVFQLGLGFSAGLEAF